MAVRREHGPGALEAFDELRGVLKANPDVTDAPWFGLPACKIGGKVFVALHGDALVVKLGAEEVDEHVADGRGTRFDPAGKGRAMKDWLEADVATTDWSALAEAAAEHTASTA